MNGREHETSGLLGSLSLFLDGDSAYAGVFIVKMWSVSVCVYTILYVLTSKYFKNFLKIVLVYLYKDDYLSLWRKRKENYWMWRLGCLYGVFTHLCPVMQFVPYAVMPPPVPKLSSVFPVHFEAPKFLIAGTHFLFSK